jgi:small subunit ribosomal protein S2
MSVISMKALLESGVHFGHRTHKWHPAMKPYIFTERNGIHIIDLQKTAKSIEQAYNLVRDTVAEGGTVLFVGTKRQAQETIQVEAIRSSMPYVTNRWLGGMLTNWRTIRQRINELDRLERMRDRGDFARITKKEGLMLERKMERLEALLGGIRKMATVPDLLFVVDVSREETAIHEANLLNIPVVALVDTNCDPAQIDYVIPSNDDAIRAIKLLVGKIADAALEGLSMRKEEVVEPFAAERLMVVAEEVELTDEELLGESTLAKLPSRGRGDLESVEEEEGEAPDFSAEEVEEDLAEEEIEDMVEEELAEELEDEFEAVPEEMVEVEEEIAEELEDELEEELEEMVEVEEEIAEELEDELEAEPEEMVEIEVEETDLEEEDEEEEEDSQE